MITYCESSEGKCDSEVGVCWRICSYFEGKSGRIEECCEKKRKTGREKNANQEKDCSDRRGVKNNANQEKDCSGRRGLKNKNS